MKKAILITVVSLLFSISIVAQDTYNEIRKSASSQLDDPTVNILVKQLNRFKLDALDYLLMKMRVEMPDSSATILDIQALALNDFMAEYIQNLLIMNDLPSTQQIKIIKKFMDASISNPFFKDKETDVVLGYYNKPDCLTRFSLDTNWEKAFADVKKSLKKD